MFLGWQIPVGTPGGISGIHTVEEEYNLMDLQEEVLEIFDHVFLTMYSDFDVVNTSFYFLFDHQYLCSQFIVIQMGTFSFDVLI